MVWLESQAKDEMPEGPTWQDSWACLSERLPTVPVGQNPCQPLPKSLLSFMHGFKKICRTLSGTINTEFIHLEPRIWLAVNCFSNKNIITSHQISARQELFETLSGTDPALKLEEKN